MANDEYYREFYNESDYEPWYSCRKQYDEPSANAQRRNRAGVACVAVVAVLALAATVSGVLVHEADEATSAAASGRKRCSGQLVAADAQCFTEAAAFVAGAKAAYAAHTKCRASCTRSCEKAQQDPLSGRCSCNPCKLLKCAPPFTMTCSAGCIKRHPNSECATSCAACQKCVSGCKREHTTSVALVCKPSAPCRLSGALCGGGSCVIVPRGATVSLSNAIVGPHSAKSNMPPCVPGCTTCGSARCPCVPCGGPPASGGLLNVNQHGAFVGSGVTFEGGRVIACSSLGGGGFGGGVVVSAGDFRCDNCAWRNITQGGAIRNSGGLVQITNPLFAEHSLSPNMSTVCASGGVQAIANADSGSFNSRCVCSGSGCPACCVNCATAPIAHAKVPCKGFVIGETCTPKCAAGHGAVGSLTCRLAPTGPGSSKGSKRAAFVGAATCRKLTPRSCVPLHATKQWSVGQLRGVVCYDVADFAIALRQASGANPLNPLKLGLACSAAAPCELSGASCNAAGSCVVVQAGVSVFLLYVRLGPHASHGGPHAVHGVSNGRASLGAVGALAYLNGNMYGVNVQFSGGQAISTGDQVVAPDTGMRGGASGGGAVFLSILGQLVCHGCSFTHNVAATKNGTRTFGGAIYAGNGGGLVNLTNPTFSHNMPSVQQDCASAAHNPSLSSNSYENLHCTGPGCPACLLCNGSPVAMRSAPNFRCFRSAAKFAAALASLAAKVSAAATSGAPAANWPRGQYALVCTENAPQCAVPCVKGSGSCVEVPPYSIVFASNAKFGPHAGMAEGALLEVRGNFSGSQLIFSGGKTGATGGAVNVDSALAPPLFKARFECNGCVFTGNSAALGGGAIANDRGHVALKFARFSSNSPNISTDCEKGSKVGPAPCVCSGVRNMCPRCCTFKPF